MRRKAPRRIASGLVVLALAATSVVSAAGCTSREQRLVTAKEAALAYFPRHVEQLEVGWSVIFGYLHRRFGVSVTTADGRLVHTAREGVVPPEMFHVFRRLVDPGARVEVIEIAELASPIDRISASAIHCRQIPLPDDWVEILGKATEKGAYALTHSVAAAEWTLENGCRQEMQLAAVHMEQVRRLEQLANDRHRLENLHAAGTDIWIEALAMFFYSGAGDRVDPDWIDTLLDLQRSDGGWPVHPKAQASNPHATALALWVLLEVLEPEAEPTTWIPRY